MRMMRAKNVKSDDDVESLSHCAVVDATRLDADSLLPKSEGITSPVNTNNEQKAP